MFLPTCFLLAISTSVRKWLFVVGAIVSAKKAKLPTEIFPFGHHGEETGWGLSFLAAAGGRKRKRKALRLKFGGGRRRDGRRSCRYHCQRQRRAAVAAEEGRSFRFGCEVLFRFVDRGDFD